MGSGAETKVGDPDLARMTSEGYGIGFLVGIGPMVWFIWLDEVLLRHMGPNRPSDGIVSFVLISFFTIVSTMAAAPWVERRVKCAHARGVRSTVEALTGIQSKRRRILVSVAFGVILAATATLLLVLLYWQRGLI